MRRPPSWRQRVSQHLTLLDCGLRSDAAVKQILLQLDETSDLGSRFIVHDLDDEHVLVKASEIQRVERDLEIELEKNSFVSFE